MGKIVTGSDGLAYYLMTLKEKEHLDERLQILETAILNFNEELSKLAHKAPNDEDGHPTIDGIKL